MPARGGVLPIRCRNRLKDVLRQAADAGRVPAELVDSFAHILLAAGNEMALVIALSDNVAAAQATAEAAVDEFLSRLLRPRR